jgi:hypothetical protein
MPCQQWKREPKPGVIDYIAQSLTGVNCKLRAKLNMVEMLISLKIGPVAHLSYTCMNRQFAKFEQYV